jgi:tetratricopeptide (TPR) repeat protein
MCGRSALVALSFIVWVPAAQSQITGSQDYGLGGSSVSWLPRPSALFLNPSSLARLHQGDVHFATNRFSGLSSLSASYFVPSVGTFGVGIGNESSVRYYSFGYGLLVSKYFAVGGALNALQSDVDYTTVSVGASVHLPRNETMNSGLHFGASALNLAKSSSVFGASVGLGYWIAPNVVRVQGAWLFRSELGEGTAGLFVRLNQWVALYTGTRAFKEIAGGFGFRSSYVNVDLALGERGMSLTLNLRFTDDSRQVRDAHFDGGLKAYDDGRFNEAYNHFRTALEYDEYYTPARSFAALASSARETTIVIYLREGERNEDRGNYPAAIATYIQLLKADAGNKEARRRLVTLENRFYSRVQQLVLIGDSLREEKKFDRARSSYREALKYDPENKEILQRVSEMESGIKERVQYHAARAKSFASKNQFDDARKEYEQVLVYDPRNLSALSRLESLEARKTTTELLERGKALFNQGNYLDALTIFLDVMQREQNNKDAKMFVDSTRAILQRDIEDQFKAGLQLYVKENYTAALEIWERLLLIQPTHQATLEYSKRAKEKLEALEKLK